MARGNNTRNPGSDLFRTLTRIFSGPLVNRRSQTGRRLRRYQLDKYASKFNSASGQSFKSSRYSTFTHMQPSMMNQQNRAERYVDFDQMEYEPTINSALDIYADEMTTHSALQPMLNIKSSQGYGNEPSASFPKLGRRYSTETECSLDLFYLHLPVFRSHGTGAL